jgi:hypothetical protein
MKKRAMVSMRLTSASWSRGGFVAESPDEPVPVQLVDHRADVGLGDGEYPDGYIPYQFDQGPSHPDRDHFSKGRIDPSANDDLETLFELLLDHEPVDRCRWVERPDITEDLVIRATQGFYVPDAGDHPPGVTFVHDLGRDNFQYQGKAGDISSRNHFRDGGGEGIPGNRDANLL